MAMWLAPCVKAVLTSVFKSSKVWPGRAKMKSMETVSKATVFRARCIAKGSMLLRPRSV